MDTFMGRSVIYSEHDYPRVYWPEHKLCHDGRCVRIHRIVAAEKYGGIPDGVHVHHIDEDVNNWNQENLVLIDPSDHATLHKKRLGGLECLRCGKEFDPDNSKRKYCSVGCFRMASEKIDWPLTGELKRRSVEIGFSALSREIGVSDNSIRKRIRNHS